MWIAKLTNAVAIAPVTAPNPKGMYSNGAKSSAMMLGSPDERLAENKSSADKISEGTRRLENSKSKNASFSIPAPSVIAAILAKK